MKKLFSVLIFILMLNLLSVPYQLKAQMKDLHGDDAEFRMGVHAGNQFRITFFNDGTYGATADPYVNGYFIGEWPINGGLYYFRDGNIFVGTEVKSTSGNTVHIFSENKSANVGGSSGDKRTDGSWRTFLPLKGFANSNNDRIAMARGSVQLENSWPESWPDIGDTTNPYGLYSSDAWAGSWNGYFGRDIFNADEESYFVADDYTNDEFSFYPDSNDTNRRGLGLRIYVRGFQWSKPAVQDGIFCLYDIQNISTTNYDRIVFGYKIGNNIGEANSSNQDSGDDEASFSKADDLAYMWDRDDIGGLGRTPVGYMGGAFLESPGNSYDGIDNDNDGALASGPSQIYTTNGLITPRWGTGINITTAMFDRGILALDNPQIVLIDYSSPIFQRSAPTTLRAALTAVGKGPADTIFLTYGSKVIKVYAGMSLLEVGNDILDNNLNGIIDENRGYQDANNVWNYLYFDNGTGYKCVDYFNNDVTTNGVQNPLLDEGRIDGIDNDGDWKLQIDDVGADGIGPLDRNYEKPDIGEGDGVPSPGEPHFDKTDIDETDMMGLTSFLLYVWNSAAGSQQSDDEWLWTNLTPGNFSGALSGNIELLYGSGYFPLQTGQLERLSMAILCGWDYNMLLRSKGYFAEAYNQNYNFSKSPNIPTVQAIAGNNKVTLMWDSLAEYSYDPILGFDFEGYKIYRSTDPGFNDATPITDAYGSIVFREPIAQFDLVNTISGLAPIPTNGVQFNLGNNSGLRHIWVDTTAKNGFTYFYAVTSYDKGDEPRRIDPSECTKYIAVSQDGTVNDKGTNVVLVKPEAPSAGFVPAKFKDSKITSSQSNTASGVVDYEIVEPSLLKNNHAYQITFRDAITGSGASRTKSTRDFNLIDVTLQDTVLFKSPLLSSSNEQMSLVQKNGFKLSFSGNPASITIDTNRTRWSSSIVPPYNLQLFDADSVNFMLGDFKLVIGQVGIRTSTYFRTGNVVMPSVPVNFNVINTRTGKNVDFAFRERDTLYGALFNGSKKGVFSTGRQATLISSDEIIFLMKTDSPWVASWRFRLLRTTLASDSNAKLMQPFEGDSISLVFNYPFLSSDTLRFTTTGEQIDQALAKVDLEKIRVVPNPYIVTNSWEPHNPYINGRGVRQLHFTHLPKECTIRIFNVRGQLVNTLDHNSTLTNGTYIWNMLSRDNLEISYGVYIYHVNAPGVGEKIGKFAVIK